MKSSVQFSFLGLAGSLEEARFAVLPVPYDATQSFRTGARFAPAEIIRVSTMLEPFDHELGIDVSKYGIYTLPELEVSCVPEKTLANVEEAISEIFSWGKFPAVLGGDHSLSIGAVRAASKKFKEFGVLQIDAHPDLLDEYMGTKFGHASAMRRCRELSKCVQACLRVASEEEQDFIDSKKPQGIFWGNNPPIKKIIDALPKNVYISFDLDAFDPSLVPDVGNPEPAGISWEAATALLKEVFASRNVVGFDMVELAPTTLNSNSAVVAAKLTAKMIGYASSAAAQKKAISPKR